MEQTPVNTQEWHKKQAMQCFNETWSLIDKTDRTREEDFKMIHMAHASRFHWGEVGTPLHFLRGEWQISRVYALLSKGESARHHAEYCLELCLSNNIGDFDLAFAYEALARAHGISGHQAQKAQYLSLAKETAEQIAKPEDKAYLLGEFQSLE